MITYSGKFRTATLTEIVQCLGMGHAVVGPSSSASGPGMLGDLSGGGLKMIDGLTYGKPVMTTQLKCGPFTQLVPIVLTIFTN